MILDIYRCSINDGPGIRTTVFLKGCNLRCIWCHNPESHSIKQTLRYLKEKCTYCKRCELVCTKGVHKFILSNENLIHEINRDNCLLCGECENTCLTEALTILGKEMSVEQVLEIVLKDKEYYKASNGGVTISGGEPLIQPDFTHELLKQCKKNNIHTCIETAGNLNKKVIDKIIDVTDLILYDFKASNPNMQKKYTNGDYNLIINNLKYLNEKKKKVWLRCPIIPTINDTEEHFNKIVEISIKFNNIEQVELIPYHNYGKDKWEQIGYDYKLKELNTVSKEKKEEWISILYLAKLKTSMNTNCVCIYK